MVQVRTDKESHQPDHISGIRAVPPVMLFLLICFHDSVAPADSATMPYQYFGTCTLPLKGGLQKLGFGSLLF